MPCNTKTSPKMPDYQQGKVYRILQDGVKTVYIGSTCQTLSARMGQHRKGLTKYPNWKLYKLMAEVGVDHFSIELIVDCPCDRREILNRAEGEQIRIHGTIAEGGNKCLAGRTRAEYRQSPEGKAKQAENDQLPERKAYHAEYRNRPESKAKMSEYMRRPEVKVKQAEYLQRPGVKAKQAAKQAEYNQRPEIKAKKKEQRRQRRLNAATAAAAAVVD